MTGFARVQTETPEFSLTVTIKSVNHRALDVQMRLPAALEPFEMASRQAVKSKVARGYLQVSAAVEMRKAPAVRINRQLVEAYLAAYRDLAREHGISSEPDLNGVFRIAGVVSLNDSAETGPSNLESEWQTALQRALLELASARQREGAGIVEEMQRRSAAIAAALERIDHLRQGLTQTLAARMAQRLEEILTPGRFDPQRILQEAAILAERSDVSEEIQRLRAHNEQLHRLIAPEANGEVGKKLDFLLQEMNREANTIVSKTSGIGETGLEITDLGLAVKADIEKVREQAMNLE